MKKKIIGLLLVATMAFGLIGCQGTVKSMGGSMTITLPENTKLELITWKDDDSLWHLTRPMREDDVAKTHTYQQKSEFGVFEGMITIVETKTK